MTKGIAIKYTEEQLEFLCAREQMPRRELTDLFNQTFDTALSADTMKAKCLRMGLSTGRNGCFKLGHDSWNIGVKGSIKPNRTSFKKGMTPHNHKPIGWLRITVDGYLEMKVAEPNKFKAVSHIVYENHIGVIPKGQVVIFRDGDTRNVDPDNLTAVTREELALLNRRLSFRKAPVDVKPVIITLAKLQATTHKKMREVAA